MFATNSPFPKYATVFSASATRAMSSVIFLSKLVCTTDTYAASKASAVNAAEPIANPLPVAAVVLPSESSISVRSLTSGG